MVARVAVLLPELGGGNGGRMPWIISGCGSPKALLLLMGNQPIVVINISWYL
jgi:hypothetical protein